MKNLCTFILILGLQFIASSNNIPFLEQKSLNNIAQANQSLSKDTHEALELSKSPLRLSSGLFYSAASDPSSGSIFLRNLTGCLSSKGQLLPVHFGLAALLSSRLARGPKVGSIIARFYPSRCPSISQGAFTNFSRGFSSSAPFSSAYFPRLANKSLSSHAPLLRSSHNFQLLDKRTSACSIKYETPMAKVEELGLYILASERYFLEHLEEYMSTTELEIDSNEYKQLMKIHDKIRRIRCDLYSELIQNPVNLRRLCNLYTRTELFHQLLLVVAQECNMPLDEFYFDFEYDHSWY